MSVQGPTPLPIRPFVPPAANAAPAPRAASAHAPAAAKPAASAEGSLWDVLTDEERAFFAQQASLGSLTYGRARTSTPAANGAPIGGRLDVRG